MDREECHELANQFVLDGVNKDKIGELLEHEGYPGEMVESVLSELKIDYECQEKKQSRLERRHKRFHAITDIFFRYHWILFILAVAIVLVVLYYKDYAFFKQVSGFTIDFFKYYGVKIVLFVIAIKIYVMSGHGKYAQSSNNTISKALFVGLTYTIIGQLFFPWTGFIEIVNFALFTSAYYFFFRIAYMMPKLNSIILWSICLMIYVFYNIFLVQVFDNVPVFFISIG